MRSWFAVLFIGLALSGRACVGDASIHRMLVGNRVLDLRDTTRLTSSNDGEVTCAWVSPDGKYIAYQSETTDKEQRADLLCTMRSTGGRPNVLLKCMAPGVESDQPSETWIPMSHTGNPAVWSRDGKLIAFAAYHRIVGPNSVSDEVCTFVMTPTGQRRALFHFPKDTWTASDLMWSPDSRSVACIGRVVHREQERAYAVTELFVCDVQNGSVRSIFSREKAKLKLDSWSGDGKAVRYYSSRVGSRWEYMESSLDGKPNVVIEEVNSVPRRSPDGRMRLADKPGLCVEDCATGEVTEVAKQFDGKNPQWTPDSRILAFTRVQALKDLRGARATNLNTIWLAATETNQMNHMCVALDSDEASTISLSLDCTKMAYVREGKLHLAELAWVDMTTQERLDAGLPLTEEEEKELLLNNAKQIGTGMAMYMADWDDKLPSRDNFLEELAPYLREKGLFLRPGTEDVAFQYMAPGSTAGEIANPAETVMGMFDVGYGWQVILYADGHCQVVPKQ